MKLSRFKRKSRISLLLPLFFIMAAFALTGCEKDYNYVAPATPSNGGGGGGGNAKTVFFATDIQPIFTANCAKAGCHNGTIAPNLSAGSAYSEVMPYVNTAQPASSDLYIQITQPVGNPAMPEGGPALTTAETTKILTWIQEGATNN
jgi:hypothetical protein